MCLYQTRVYNRVQYACMLHSSQPDRHKYYEERSEEASKKTNEIVSERTTIRSYSCTTAVRSYSSFFSLRRRPFLYTTVPSTYEYVAYIRTYVRIRHHSCLLLPAGKIMHLAFLSWLYVFLSLSPSSSSAVYDYKYESSRQLRQYTVGCIKQHGAYKSHIGLTYIYRVQPIFVAAKRSSLVCAWNFMYLFCATIQQYIRYLLYAFTNSARANQAE